MARNFNGPSSSSGLAGRDSAASDHPGRRCTRGRALAAAGWLWFGVRALLASVLVGVDVYYITRVGMGSWHPMGLRAAKHALLSPVNGTGTVIEILPDTGYNLIALPVHWMGLQAFWFVCAAQTMETWRALTNVFEATDNTRSLKFPLI